MSNITRGKFPQNANTLRVLMLSRGPLVRPIVDALHNPTNLRDPEEDQRSSHNGQSTGQKNFVVPQYQLVQEPILPSVSYSVLFNGLW